MQITESHMLFLAGVIVLSCIVSLLPFKTHSQRYWILYFPILPIATDFVYEALMITKFIDVNIRIDLLLIAPLMIAMAVKTTTRWELAAGSTVPPASGLSTASYITGLCSILLYQWLIFSLAAVAFGHAAQVLATRRGVSAAKTRYIAGLLMGYITLSLAVIGYDTIYSFLVVCRLLHY